MLQIACVLVTLLIQLKVAALLLLVTASIIKINNTLHIYTCLLVNLRT